jgi:hypothetical protein
MPSAVKESDAHTAAVVRFFQGCTATELVQLYYVLEWGLALYDEDMDRKAATLRRFDASTPGTLGAASRAVQAALADSDLKLFDDVLSTVEPRMLVVQLASDSVTRLERDGMDVKGWADVHRKAWRTRQGCGPVEPVDRNPWVVLRTTPRAKRHWARKARLYGDGSLEWLTACNVLYETSEGPGGRRGNLQAV